PPGVGVGTGWLARFCPTEFRYLNPKAIKTSAPPSILEAAAVMMTFLSSIHISQKAVLSDAFLHRAMGGNARSFWPRMNGGTCLRLNSLAALKSLKTKKPRRAFGSPPWKTKSTSPTKPWKFCGIAVAVAELNPGGKFVGVVFRSAWYRASAEAALREAT